MLLQMQGLTWEPLGDPKELAKLAEAGEPRTAFEERVQAKYAALKAEGYAQGIEEAREKVREEGFERERELLTVQARLEFGTETANDLARHLAGIADHEHLMAVCEWIVTSASGSQLLDRVRAGF